MPRAAAPSWKAAGCLRRARADWDGSQSELLHAVEPGWLEQCARYQLEHAGESCGRLVLDCVFTDHGRRAELALRPAQWIGGDDEVWELQGILREGELDGHRATGGHVLHAEVSGGERLELGLG